MHDPVLLERIQSLAIPPAWSEVWICRSPRGHLQCTGPDDRSRKQYLYHPRWKEFANVAKFSHLHLLGKVLPRIRRRTLLDLRKPAWSIAKLAAVAVRILDRTAIRVGNREYARDNDSYGLTTLEPQHVKVSNQQLSLSFVGKGGKECHFSFRDPILAPLVQELRRSQVSTLLSCLVDGQALQLDSAMFNGYLREITGSDITGKDFRTWSASALFAEVLAGEKPSGTQHQILNKAVRRASEKLGNTMTVCRKYYIHPVLIECYEEGIFPGLLQPVSAREPETFSHPGSTPALFPQSVAKSRSPEK